jgi:hypothetical protein
MKWPDRPRQVLRTGGGYSYLSAAALQATRIPAGHPEGFLEAFANLYKNFAAAVRVALSGKKVSADMLDFPTIQDGVRGMAFIETVVRSSKSNQKWTKMPTV